MKRPNVHVRTHAHATEIVFEGKRAVGVRYVLDAATKGAYDPDLATARQSAWRHLRTERGNNWRSLADIEQLAAVEVPRAAAEE